MSGIFVQTLGSSEICHEKWSVLIRGKMISGFYLSRRAKPAEVLERGEMR